jgi:hypothetical protein
LWIYWADCFGLTAPNGPYQTFVRTCIHTTYGSSSASASKAPTSASKAPTCIHQPPPPRPQPPQPWLARTTSTPTGDFSCHPQLSDLGSHLHSRLMSRPVGPAPPGATTIRLLLTDRGRRAPSGGTGNHIDFRPEQMPAASRYCRLLILDG